jgi:hypothetical protein
MLCAHTNLVRDSIFSGRRPIFSISHSVCCVCTLLPIGVYFRPAKYTRKYLHPAPFCLRDILPLLPPPISVMQHSQRILFLCPPCHDNANAGPSSRRQNHLRTWCHVVRTQHHQPTTSGAETIQTEGPYHGPFNGIVLALGRVS